MKPAYDTNHEIAFQLSLMNLVCRGTVPDTQLAEMQTLVMTEDRQCIYQTA